MSNSSGQQEKDIHSLTSMMEMSVVGHHLLYYLHALTNMPLKKNKDLFILTNPCTLMDK